MIARYYDLLVGDYDADIDLYAGFARRLDAPVLELAVGSGRVAVPLAAMGVTVYGIDVSAVMLSRARARAAAAGVSVKLEQADLCDYRFDARFGLIYCAIDGFLHLCEAAQQIAALRLAGAHLAADGRLVLDLPALIAGHWAEWEPGVRPLELVWSGTGPAGGHLQHLQTFTADQATQRRHVTHLFDETGDDGVVHRTAVGYDLRFIFPGEIPLLAAAAGLRLDALYGGYDLEPFTDSSERMIAVIGSDGR